MADTRLSIPMVNGATIHLLPGFRFRPSDHELVIKYLYPRAIHLPLPCAIITDVDIHQHNPWDIVPVAERENGKHFFTRKEVKYPGSRRNNRVAGDGFWRVAGSEVPIYYKPEGAADDVLVGMRRTLVFNYGKSRSAERTEWAMSEFRLAGAGLFPRPMMRCATSSGSKPPCGCLEATIAKVGDDGSVEEKTNGKHFFIREENERLGDHHNSRAADDGFWRSVRSEVPVYHKCSSGINEALVGMKRTMVFHYGNSSSAEHTEWVMQEFRFASGSLIACIVTRSATGDSSMLPCRCAGMTIAIV